LDGQEFFFLFSQETELLGTFFIKLQLQLQSTDPCQNIRIRWLANGSFDP